MRAAVLDTFGGQVAVRDVKSPRPEARKVLVAVEADGVGLTLERARIGALGGSVPRIVGHEMGGRVAEVGPGVDAGGDRVTTACGLCRWWAGCRETLCDDWRGYVGTTSTGAGPAREPRLRNQMVSERWRSGDPEASSNSTIVLRGTSDQRVRSTEGSGP